MPSIYASVLQALAEARLRPPEDRAARFAPRIDPEIAAAKARFERDPRVKRLPVRVYLADAAVVANSTPLAAGGPSLHDLFEFAGAGYDAAGELLPVERIVEAARASGRPALAAIEARLNLVPENLLDLLPLVPGLLQIDTPAGIGPDLDYSVPELFRPAPAAPLPFSGKGVIVGIVDFGCDFAHPNFINEDGSSRILRLILLDIDGTVIRDIPRALIDDALRANDPYRALGYWPHRPANQAYPGYEPETAGAHGSIVMDIAAGNGRGTGLPGVAREADIVFVQLQTAGDWHALDTAVPKAIQRLFDIAADRPLVVNLSVSPRFGARASGGEFGDWLAGQLVDARTGAVWQPETTRGRAIVVSAGNYRGASLRTSGRVSYLGTGTEKVRDLRWTTTDREVDRRRVLRFYQPLAGPGLELEVHYPPGRGDGTSPTSLALGGRIPTVGALWLSFVPGPLAGSLNAPLRQSVLTLTAEAERERGHDWRIVVRLAGKTAAAAAGQARPTGETSFYAWIQRDDERQSVFGPDDGEMARTLNHFATASPVIAVGSYYAPSGRRLPRFYSSEGPSESDAPFGAAGFERPDVIAPGHGIHAAKSYSGPLPADERHGPVHERLVVASGTSMATAHVTGLVACLFERNPDLSHEQVRRALIASAEPLDGQRPGAWDPRAGFGRVSGRTLLA